MLEWIRFIAASSRETQCSLCCVQDGRRGLMAKEFTHASYMYRAEEVRTQSARAQAE